MKLIGKLTQLLPYQTGTGKNGEWKKQDIILETEEQYPKKIFVSIIDAQINYNQLQIGNKLKIEYSSESADSIFTESTVVVAESVELISDAIFNQKPIAKSNVPQENLKEWREQMERNFDDDLPF